MLDNVSDVFFVMFSFTSRTDFSKQVKKKKNTNENVDVNTVYMEHTHRNA